VAEGDSGEDRSRENLTEEASPYRVEEYRRKGMVSQSREISGLLALMAAAVTVYALSPRMGAAMAEFMREVFRTDLSARVDLGSQHILAGILLKALRLLLIVGLPAALAAFVLGAVGSFAQIGTIFSTDPLTPDLDKIDPIKGLKRLISIRQFLDGIRILLKIIVLGAIFYFVIKSEVLRSPSYLVSEPLSLFGSFGRVGKVIFFPMFIVLAVFAAVDFGLNRWEYGKNVRLTKEEAKQEYKEREGDPQIKARIRSIQREMARRRMMQAVKKADVIVTNPTHIAVALLYDKEKMSSPKVVAKGADFLAQKIKKIAADAGVPMVENVPLARTLYKTVKVGQYIPRALYQAVAEVLAYVYRLKNRSL
jgi:flagellar biosynthesis protein FlhB